MEWFSILIGGWRLVETVIVAVQVCIASLPYEPPLWIIHPCLLWQCRSVLCPSLMNPLCLWIIHPFYCGSAGLFIASLPYEPPLFVDYTPLFTVAVQVCIASLPYEPPLWIIHPPPKLPHSVSDWHHSWLNVLRACHFSLPLKLMYSKYTWHVVTICQVYILRVL